MVSRKICLFAIAALSIVSLVACDMDDDDYVHRNNQPNSSVSVKLSEEEAKKKVFEVAQVSENDVTNLVVEKDFDDRTPTYDIEFVNNQTEYSYTVDANTGDIVEVGNEAIDKHETFDTTSVKLSEGDAKKIVFDLAKVSENNVTNLVVEKDFNDRTPTYDIEFVNNQTEYSYTVDANTGDILEQSMENVNS